MASLRKAVLATAILSTGLLSSTGAAFAADHGGDTRSTEDGHTSQHGVVNSKKVAPNANPDVCNNYTPINVIGAQAPIQDLAPGVSLLDHNDGSSASPSNLKGCSNPGAS